MVTPEMAENILAARGPNRNVSASVINKYARDMLAGRWQLNGQTIKISKDGQLLDGQHRLEAAKKQDALSLPLSLKVLRRRRLLHLILAEDERSVISFANGEKATRSLLLPLYDGCG